VCGFDTQTYQCRDSLTGHLTVRPPDQPLPQQDNAYAEAPLAQTGPLAFRVTTGAHPALASIDTDTGAAAGQTPLSVSGVSAPYTAYSTTVIASGDGLVLVGAGTSNPSTLSPIQTPHPDRSRTGPDRSVGWCAGAAGRPHRARPVLPHLRRVAPSARSGRIRPRLCPRLVNEMVVRRAVYSKLPGNTALV